MPRRAPAPSAPAETATTSRRHGKPSHRTSAKTNEELRDLTRAVNVGRQGQADVTADALIRACARMGAANLSRLHTLIVEAENEIARERAADAPSGK